MVTTTLTLAREHSHMTYSFTTPISGVRRYIQNNQRGFSQTVISTSRTAKGLIHPAMHGSVHI